MITYTVKVWGDGHKEWRVGGDLHRIDGPALERADGTKEWYLYGKRVTEQDVMNLKAPCNGREVVIDGVTYKLQRV